MKRLFLLLMFVSLLFSTSFTVFYSDWKVLSIAFATLSILLAALAIIGSRIFSLPHLEQAAKSEFVFAVSTLLIVSITVNIILAVEPILANGRDSLAKTLYSISYGCSGDPSVIYTQNNLADWALLYSNSVVSCSQDTIEWLDLAFRIISVPSSISFEFFMSESVGSGGYKFIQERFKKLVSILTFYMYAYYILVSLLIFIKYFAGYFFSVGVVLRSLPFTRGAGAYLMAVSIGLYFVFPLSYLFIGSLAMPYLKSEIASCVPGSAGVLACTLPDLPEVQTGGLDSGLETVSLFKANFATLLRAIETDLFGFVRHIAAAVCLLPFVALVITITFILNVTGVFGGNIPEIGRGLVKLI